jgi:ketosteroid isomerase-like protein
MRAISSSTRTRSASPSKSKPNSPPAENGSSFALTPTEYIAEDTTVVSLGHFTGVHGASGKKVDAAYAHVWDVAGGKIRRFRQYIDTLSVAEARR